MPGKASSADSFLVIGEIVELKALHDLLYHPPWGNFPEQYWRDHYCSAREWACGMERDLWTERHQVWTKCAVPFQEKCRAFVPAPLP